MPIATSMTVKQVQGVIVSYTKSFFTNFSKDNAVISPNIITASYILCSMQKAQVFTSQVLRERNFRLLRVFQITLRTKNNISHCSIVKSDDYNITIGFDSSHGMCMVYVVCCDSLTKVW